MKQAIENILIERLQTSIEGISSILTNKFFDEFDSLLINLVIVLYMYRIIRSKASQR